MLELAQRLGLELTDALAGLNRILERPTAVSRRNRRAATRRDVRQPPRHRIGVMTRAQSVRKGLQ